MRIFQVALLLPTTLFVLLFSFGHFNLLEAAQFTAIIFWSYVGSLWTSMLIYRAFFHRLHNFPGPFMMKLSKMVHVALNTNYDSYKQLDKLHAKYGEYVRTGPQTITLRRSSG